VAQLTHLDLVRQDGEVCYLNQQMLGELLDVVVARTFLEDNSLASTHTTRIWRTGAPNRAWICVSSRVSFSDALPSIFAIASSILATEQLPRRHIYTESNKTADVAEHPKVFDHVGLLVNEPPSPPGCSSISHPKNCTPSV
jgi:hypothetical protein